NVKLMDIARETSTGSVESARHSIWLVGISTLLVGIFTFLRDFPVFSTGAVDAAGDPIRTSVLDKGAHELGVSRYYEGGDLMVPFDSGITNYTWLGFEFTPLMGAIGWFMKFRVAMLVSLGTFFTWFVVTPMAFALDYPFYYPVDGLYHAVSAYPAASLKSYAYVARPMGRHPGRRHHRATEDGAGLPHHRGGRYRHLCRWRRCRAARLRRGQRLV
ncbi:MAG: hypothetical protein CXX75_03420, partial [Methanobacteriota archaeon]